MSVTLTRLRKRAADLEQKKQYDKALEVYVQILEEGGKDLGDDDVPLFNRVGDMLMRKGSVTEALGYYERAVDVYAERGFLNNAIALCSKILRQSPGRTAVYYKLGKISARKGFKSDARKNFLEYADRMQKAGMADEAFRALKEFASLYPDQDDVRLILAELLSKVNRKGEALEQLQALYERLEAEGREAEARATVDRMKAIDPEHEPRVTGVRETEKKADLVFLDLSEEAGLSPPSVRRMTPTPLSSAVVGAPVVPALDGLTLTFVPDEDDVPAQATPVRAESVLPALGDSDRSRTEDPAADIPELVMEAVEADTVEEFSVVETTEPDLDIIDAFGEPVEPADVDDLIRPLREQPPLTGNEFAVIDLEEAPQRQERRTHDLALPGELPGTPEAFVTIGSTPESMAAVEDARAAAEDAADMEADILAREAVSRTSASVSRSTTPADDIQLLPDEGRVEDEGVMFGAADTAEDVAAADAALDLLADGKVAGSTPPDGSQVGVEPDSDSSAPQGNRSDSKSFGTSASSEVDFLANPPTFGTHDEPVAHAFPPLDGLDAESSERAAADFDAAFDGPTRMHTPRSTLSIGGAERHLRRRLELEPENWNLRRQLGEALLDIGRSEDGLYELELAMVGLELDGEIERAADVADEILGVVPGSIRHHQKRVEYAVRTRDRQRLIQSYLELADALFRTGTVDKAVSVYGRVLELDGSNERAEFALATLAPDELIRRRGGRIRPERWSDELDAIPGSGIGRVTGSSPVIPAGSPVSIEAVKEAVEASNEIPDSAPLDEATEVSPAVPASASSNGSDETSPEPFRESDSAGEIEEQIPDIAALSLHWDLGVSDEQDAGTMAADPVSECPQGRDEDALDEGQPGTAEEHPEQGVDPRASYEAEGTGDPESDAQVLFGAEGGGVTESDTEARFGAKEGGVPEPEAKASFGAEGAGAPEPCTEPSFGAEGAGYSEPGDEESAAPSTQHDESEHLPAMGAGSPEEPEQAAAELPDRSTHEMLAESSNGIGSQKVSDFESDLEAWPEYGGEEVGGDAVSLDAGEPVGFPAEADDGHETRESAVDSGSAGGTDTEPAPTSHDLTAADPGLTGAGTDRDASDSGKRPESTPELEPQAVSAVTEGEAISRLEQARRLTPVGTGEGEFVDLGEWLRLTEPVKSTRMLVEDPRPTGDEQADFEELLRRFKRGVAENVEPEDYDSHYDLGVAFKEMGLVDEAIAQFQKALRGSTNRVRSYEALGQCFVEKQQYPIAAALLQRALELPGTDDQQLVGVLYLLGFATEHMGRAAAALPYYLRVFAVDIEFRDIASRVAALETQTT